MNDWITGNLDYLLFAVCAIGLFVLVGLWLRRTDRKNPLPWLAWPLLVALLIGGWFPVNQAGREERRRIRRTLEGFAPTYALEMQQLGHARLPRIPAQDDPLYLTLIAQEIRWLNVNSAVSDIYTMRKLPDGKNVFIVDAETDYDRNGKYEGERESRTQLGEVYDEVDPDLERAFQGASAFAEMPITDRWGTWVSAFAPIRDETGRVDGVLGVDFDAKVLEQGVGEARRRILFFLGLLAGGLAASTAIVAMLRSNLTERRKIEVELARARDTALAAARMKGEFLANMSHEIRTPMNGVIGMTDLLLETNLSPDQREFAETIRVSAESLLTVINDILDFSKIEAGKLEFECADFDLHETVENTLEMMAGQAHAKGLELAGFVEPRTPILLRGDAGRLRQVLTNLLGNAIKFTDQGEVMLNVSTQHDDATHVRLRFEVRDTGIGIPEEARARLFQSFMQADGSTTRQFGGTGLGLAISKQLVEKMGGEIGVESAPRLGSRFWFTAYLEKQHNAWPAPEPDASLTGAKVLIVDANASSQFLLDQITAWRMHGERASTGAEALEVLKKAANEGDPYSMAIVDMQLPDMSGLNFARTIKTNPRTAPVRLILLTPFGKPPHLEDLKNAGIDAFRHKPVRQSTLFDCLASVMAFQPAQSASHEKDSTKTSHDAGIRRGRILIVEDNAVNQRVTLAQLYKLGYTAEAVGNGREALDALSRTTYDAVLMDCHMPVMDGYEATEAIRRSDGSTRHTWVIAMTANAMKGDREKCLASGMDDYLTKPTRMEDLGAALERRPAHPDRQAIDTDSLNRLRELDPINPDEVLADLVEVFLETAPSLVKEARHAAERGDAEKLATSTHSLKSSCANFGAKELKELANDVETLAKSGSTTGTTGLLASLQIEFQRVCAALEPHRRKP